MPYPLAIAALSALDFNAGLINEFHVVLLQKKRAAKIILPY